MNRRHTLAATLAIIATAVGTGAYTLNGPKWGTQQIPYYINPANSTMSEAAAIDAIHAGAMAWTTQSGANILPYYMGRTSATTISKNGRSEVFIRNGTNGGLYGETYWWYDGSYRLIEADIAFYAGSYQFFPGSSGCSGSGLYLQDVATHEFGHALGLGHSSVTSSSMNPTMNWCSTEIRSLDSDDIAGVETLYPSSGGNTAPTVTIISPAAGSTFAEGASVTISGSSIDTQDGNISGSLSWNSSIDGYLGTGGSVTRTLSPGTHTISATVTDRGGLTASQQIGLLVTSTPSIPPPPPIDSGISLSARGYKVKGGQRVDLTWTGATTSNVRIFRNGSLVLLTGNDGRETDSLNVKGGASYSYRICDEPLSVCSATVAVIF